MAEEQFELSDEDFDRLQEKLDAIDAADREMWRMLMGGAMP